MIKHFSPLDTTDVQEVEVDRENRLYIRCYFARGSQALGCSVELVSPEDSVLWNITRENGSPVAERNIMTALPAHCYNISVSDLERDGTVGEVAVLVVEAEWDEICSPDSSSENDGPSTSNGSGAPPTSGKGTIIIVLISQVLFVVISIINGAKTNVVKIHALWDGTCVDIRLMCTYITKHAHV